MFSNKIRLHSDKATPTWTNQKADFYSRGKKAPLEENVSFSYFFLFDASCFLNLYITFQTKLGADHFLSVGKGKL